MIGHWQYDSDSYSYLQPTVDLYMSGETIPCFNAFNHISFAAGNGWLASSLLAKSVPGCESGEAPVACEYRRSKPSVALIMIGTNDLVGRHWPTTAPNYSKSFKFRSITVSFRYFRLYPQNA